jgi:hypothetical protein
MKITEEKFNGTKVIACVLDGQAVIHCDKQELNAKKWWESITRTIAGGTIGSAFAPVFGTIGGALTGYVSTFLNDVLETGYYTPQKKLILPGTYYKDAKGVLFHQEE